MSIICTDFVFFVRVVGRVVDLRPIFVHISPVFHVW